MTIDWIETTIEDETGKIMQHLSRQGFLNVTKTGLGNHYAKVEADHPEGFKIYVEVTLKFTHSATKGRGFVESGVYDVTIYDPEKTLPCSRDSWVNRQSFRSSLGTRLTPMTESVFLPGYSMEIPLYAFDQISFYGLAIDSWARDIEGQRLLNRSER